MILAMPAACAACARSVADQQATGGIISFVTQCDYDFDTFFEKTRVTCTVR